MLPVGFSVKTNSLSENPKKFPLFTEYTLGITLETGHNKTVMEDIVTVWRINPPLIQVERIRKMSLRDQLRKVVVEVLRADIKSMREFQIGYYQWYKRKGVWVIQLDDDSAVLRVKDTKLYSERWISNHITGGQRGEIFSRLGLCDPEKHLVLVIYKDCESLIANYNWNGQEVTYSSIV